MRYSGVCTTMWAVFPSASTVVLPTLGRPAGDEQKALNCGGPASQAAWVPVVVDSALLPTRLGDAVHGGPQPVSRLAGGRARRGLGLDAGEERRILVRAWGSGLSDVDGRLPCPRAPRLIWVLGPRCAPGDMMIDGGSRGDGVWPLVLSPAVQRSAGGQCLRGSWPHAHQRSAGRARARQPCRCRWSATGQVGARAVSPSARSR